MILWRRGEFERSFVVFHASAPTWSFLLGGGCRLPRLLCGTTATLLIYSVFQSFNKDAVSVSIVLQGGMGKAPERRETLEEVASSTPSREEVICKGG